MMYLGLVFISIALIIILAKQDKSYCNKLQIPLKDKHADEWVSHFDGRKKIYFILMVVSLIPYVNWATAIVSLIINFIVLAIRIFNSDKLKGIWDKIF